MPSVARALLTGALAAALLLGEASAVCRPRPRPPTSNGKNCTVKALGDGRDDTPQILQAFADCNNGGTVVFPQEETYNIATRLNPVVQDVTVEWRGKWLFSDNLTYWRANSYPITFQNHHAGFILSGKRIAINGYNTGGINGNGDTWYTAEAGVTQPGRPMAFVLWNISDVTVQHFYVHQSPLWSINIMNGTNMVFDDINVNNTATKAPYGANWVQNTDGFDTMDARNIRLTNFVYQGGDDAIAIKPRSFNITCQNLTIHGGNSVAIGSLGQYLEDASVVDVLIKDVSVITNNNDMHNSAYIKTWIGEMANQSSYESGYQPRGGGWGIVKNIRFENFDVEGAVIGPAINQDNGNNGSFSGTSNFEISNVEFFNFKGWLNATNTNVTTKLSCSLRKPCHNITFADIALRFGATPTSPAHGAQGSCVYVPPAGQTGMVGPGC